MNEVLNNREVVVLANHLTLIMSAVKLAADDESLPGEDDARLASYTSNVVADVDKHYIDEVK